MNTPKCNETINSKNEKNLIECACKVGNKLYFFTAEYNSLNYYDFEENRRELLGVVPWEPIDGKSLYFHIFYYEEKLILIPFRGEYITIYNLKEKKFYRNEKRGAYTGACLHGGNIYLAPMDSLFLFKYDLGKNLIENVVNTDIETNKKDRSVCDISFLGDKLFWGLCNGTTFYSVDIRDKKRNNFDLQGLVDQIRSVKVCGDYIFVSDFARSRAILLSKNGDLLKEYVFNISFDSEMDKYHRVFNLGNKIVIRYINSDDIFIIDLEDVEKKEDIIKCEKKAIGKGECIADGSKMLVLPCLSRASIKYEDGKEFEIDLSIPKQIVNMECGASYILNEKMLSLSKYLELLEK